MTIGERIKEIRTQKGLSQEELAKRMGYKTRSAVCQVERNGNNITSDRIEAFANALNVSVQTLMGWNENIDYVVTQEEHKIIVEFRNADELTQEMIKRLLFYPGQVYSLDGMNKEAPNV